METLIKKDTVKTITAHYIDEAFVESHGKEVIDIIKPTNGQVIARVTLGDEEDTIRDRIERARKESDLPSDVKPDTFARYLSVIMAGLAVQAASSATLPELKRTISMFCQTMPIPMD